jgi:hypothetical protein
MYETFVVPLLRSARKPRPRTCGILLDKMSKSMGGLRMPISIVEGNRRPHDLVQATKFALEVGVAVRHQIPILTHWKHYKKPSGVVHYMNFVEGLTVCISILS